MIPMIARPAREPAIPPTIAPVLISTEVDEELVAEAAEADEREMGETEANELAIACVARASVGITVDTKVLVEVEVEAEDELVDKDVALVV